MHVLGMGEQLQEQALAAYIAATRWTRVVAIKPTGAAAQAALPCSRPPRCLHCPLQRPSSLPECRVGTLACRRMPTRRPAAGWSHRRTGGLDLRTSGCVTLVGVPYSEHSSFTDLR